jgi:hypothetical protein
MDDRTRENVVTAGSLAAQWAIRKNGGGVLEQAGALGAIDGIHTGYVVTRNTGDERLGRRAGVRAGVRTGGWLLAAFGAPVVLFLGAVIGSMAMGVDADTQGSMGIPLLVVCFALFMVLAVKAGRAGQRNAYTRFNLPSEDEMNRSGYYEVEPDTWFNPITDQVQMGHAYVRSEMRTWVRGDRTEDQAIRALYKQRRSFQAPQSPAQTTHHVPKRYSTGSR